MADRYRQLDRRYRRALRWGLLVSITAHLFLFVTFDAVPLPRFASTAAGERRGDFRAARGGGMEAIEFRSPPEAAESQPEPEPTPDEVVEPEEPEDVEESDEELALPAIALADGLTVPGPVAPLDIPGLATGTGEGDGGADAEGRSGVVPPRPRGVILPPGDRPERVRGREVEVWVFVNPAGKVVPDSTRLNPPTGDRRFDRRLREHAASWLFDAARRDGRPVAEWFRYTIIM